MLNMKIDYHFDRCLFVYKAKIVYFCNLQATLFKV